MPIYEYRCTNCGFKFEKLCPISDSGSLMPCPKCQGKAERLLSQFTSFAKTEGGLSNIGGSSCSSCSGGSCSSCGL